MSDDSPVPAKRRRPARQVHSDSEDDIEPRAGPARQRFRAATEDLDLLDSEDDAEGSVPKRQRQSHNDETGHEEEEDEDEVQENRREYTRPELQRDTDGYVPGSITRIKLINFMTYDRVEFRPGPYLNMILGPNGTGKSTVAAGLAIGLGFPPKVMGRASDLKSYVKQGREEASTEIELKAGPGKKNIVLQCRFTREDDKAEWKINGQPSTRKAAVKMVTDFGVQANNLCSFLPQDKVAQFAQMSPQEMLAETMRAAGDVRLTSWHEQLVQLGKAKHESQENLKASQADRDRTRAQVDMLAPDVEQVNQRAELTDKLEGFAILKLVATTNILQQERNELQQEQNAASTKLAAARKKLAPVNNLLKQEIKEPISQIERKERESEKITTELSTLKHRMKRQREQREKFQADVAACEEVLARPAVDNSGKIRELNERKVRLAGDHADENSYSAKMRQLRDKAEELEGQAEDDSRRISRINKEIEEDSKRQMNLQSAERRREDAAREWDPSIAFALDYLAKHEAEFDQSVCRPPVMSVNCTERRYVKQVENATNASQRKTFIAQTSNDYNRLINLNGEQYPGGRRRNGNTYPPGQVRLHVAYMNVTEESLNPRRPCDPDQLRALGFAGWAADFVQAEPAVVAFLNMRCNMHATAITTNPSSTIDSNAAVQAGITAWICATDSVRATRSRYGRRDVQLSVNSIGPAKSWADSQDNEAIGQLAERIAARKREKLEMEKPHLDVKRKVEEARTRYREVVKDIRDIEDEIKILKDANSDRGVAEENLAKAQRLLKACEKEDLTAKRDELLRQSVNKLRARLPLLRSAWSTNDAALAVTETLITTSLQQALMNANTDCIEARVNELSIDYHEAQHALEDVDKRYKVKAASQKISMARMIEALRSTKDTIKEFVMKYTKDRGGKLSHEDGEQIDNEYAEIESMLELSADIDSGVVEKHQQATNTLAELETTVADLEGKLEELVDRVDRILTDFEPALEALMGLVDERFSKAFESVGCTGEVRVDKPAGGFEKWGIEILVSYRDGEPLAQLSGKRQSGGERTLATIMYLLALTEMGRTPFSLVDEINQGMDQRAERNVHNQLVNVTCSDHAQQYFLITPKLLTDLTYHRRMRILNVGNGAYVPPADTGKKRKLHWADLRSCVQAVQRSRVAVH